MGIVKRHKCELCEKDYKRHTLDHWYEIINEELPKSRRITNTKKLSKIFKALKPEGVFWERFLLGKRKCGIKENFYLFRKIYK